MSHPDPAFWSGRRVLLTGHTGFKGAWLARWLQHLGADVTGLALPAEHERGIFPALAPWSDLDEHLVDLLDAEALRSTVLGARPDVVLHLAAQSLVRRSYRDPSLTYATNVVGTANLLDACVGSTVAAIVVVTSDKVYRQDGRGAPFTEDEPLGGGDPYSASKACVELLVPEWSRRSGTIAVATARAGNVIGGGDRGEDRLLVDLVASAETGEPARLRNPTATRPWQHVLDPLAGYLLLAESLAAGRPTPAALNFGPSGASASVGSVADDFVAALGRGSWTHEEAPQPPEAQTLAIDAGLAGRSLGWAPRLDLAAALEWTASWYSAQLDGRDLAGVTDAQIDAYGRDLAR